jgi:1,4-alpha-glucan branching enzyme
VGDCLGSHPDGRRALVLTYLAGEASYVSLEGRRRMTRCGRAPVYAWLGPRDSLPKHYRVSWTDRYGERHTRHDPYAFGAPLHDGELEALTRGMPDGADLLGAEPVSIDGISGVRFAVWAPRALGVELTLPGGPLLMYAHDPSGVWSLFVPETPAGTPYGFDLCLAGGHRVWHTDPYGRAFEPRPGWRARVTSLPAPVFEDDRWVEERSRRGADGPLSIYELHLGSFLRRPAESASYAALAERIVRHVVPLGFTHVELLPITEHPFEGSWGYQTTGYHAPTHRHGTPDDFRSFINRLHMAGIGVILDWVPGHFANDAAALADFDGAALYEYADPLLGRHAGWGTRVFDLTRPEVRAFLLSSARRFVRDYHVDGLRIDAVAAMLYRDYDRGEGQWSANVHGGREHLEGIAFLQALTEMLHREFPGVLVIAEDSSLYPGVTAPVSQGGLGFDYKWNLGWMHDSLTYFREDPLFRRHHHHALQRIVTYSRTERGVTALSHDEVVHGKRSITGRLPGDAWQKLANLRLLLVWQWTHPGAKLLFMGTELADPDEWSHARALDWERAQKPGMSGILLLLTDLNRLYTTHPALIADDRSEQGTRWIAAHDALRSVHVLERRSGRHRMIIILNATPVPRERYAVGLPCGGRWVECLNSDSRHYGGSDVGNWGAVVAHPDPAMGEPYSTTLRLPPLGAIVLIAEVPQS